MYPTINRGSFGQDGDSTLCHIFLILNGGAFGPPAVRANKQEVPCQVGLFGSLQHPPENGQMILQHTLMSSTLLLMILMITPTGTVKIKCKTIFLCTFCGLVDFLFLMWYAAKLDSLDVILVGKDDDPTSIRGLHQSLDDLLKLPWSGFSGNLYGLCNTKPP